jgi:hypothetical protein
MSMLAVERFDNAFTAIPPASTYNARRAKCKTDSISLFVQEGEGGESIALRNGRWFGALSIRESGSAPVSQISAAVLDHSNC